MPDLDVHGLVNGAARALLSSSVQFTLDERVRDRILAETRGNPLALLELPRGERPTQLAGGFAVPEARDLSKRIEQSYIRRLEALPEDGRRLLLVAAAEPVGDPLLLRRACERLGIALSAVDARTDCWQSTSASPSATPWRAQPCTGPPAGRSAGRHTWRWPRRLIGTSIQIVVRGIGLRELPGPTRRSRTSWSSRRAGRKRAAASLPRPRSCSVRSC